MLIGSLVIEMSANVARLTTDMAAVKSVVNKTMQDVQAAVDTAKKAFIAMTGIASVAAFEGMIKGALEAAAKLHSLSIQAGITVENLSGLAAVGKATGTGADMIAAASNKMSKALASANEDSKGAATALKALGLSFDDFQHLLPDERLVQVARAMNGFHDGAQKSAAAMMLMGKSGAEMLPFLRDLGQAGDLNAKVTTEQAEAAHKFEVQLGQLKIQSEAWKKAMAMAMVDTLVDINNLLLSVTSSSKDLGAVLGGYLTDSMRFAVEWAIKLVTAFRAAGIAIAGIAAVYTQAFTFNFSGAKAASEGMIEDLDKVFGQMDAATAKWLKAKKNGKDGEDRMAAAGAKAYGGLRDITGLAGDKTGGAPRGPKDDPAMKILEGQLKALENYIADEKKLLGSREQRLDFFQQLEYTTLRDSETKKQGLLQDALGNALGAYDKEIVAIRAYVAEKQKLGEKVATADGLNKLAEAQKHRADAEVESNGRIIDSQLKLLAVQRQFDLVTKEHARMDKIGNESMQFQIDMLGKNTLEVLKLTEARRIQLDLDQGIYQLKKLDPLADTSGAIAQAAVQTAQATALIAADYNKQRSAIYGADEALRKYIEDAGNQAAKMEQVFGNAFQGMEDALTTFASTGKLSFSSFATSVVADIDRMIIKQQLLVPLAEYMKAGSSAGTGFGGFLTSGIKALLGGGGGAIGPQISSMGASSLIPGFASGGDPPVGRPYWVGENGPELRIDRVPGTIVPNKMLTGAQGGQRSVNQTNNFHISGPIDRRSQSQIACAVGAAIQSAMSRDA